VEGLGTTVERADLAEDTFLLFAETGVVLGGGLRFPSRDVLHFKSACCQLTHYYQSGLTDLFSTTSSSSASSSCDPALGVLGTLLRLFDTPLVGAAVDLGGVGVLNLGTLLVP
jgi:hypothetical protein